jgi:kinesin family protein C1
VYVRVRPIIRGEKDEASGEAPIIFPDARDHKEIVLSSSSESAMGNQRKEVFAFNFDRVSLAFDSLSWSIHLEIGL